MTPREQSNLLANALLCASQERGELLTPLKLQKLMFYADAWSMVLYDEELTQEKFQAWVHGPVAVSQYQRFKEFRWNPIVLEIERPELTTRAQKHIDEVLSVFGVESAISLERMTHAEDPWIRARTGYEDTEACTVPIDKQLTKQYYSKIGEESED